MYPLLKERTIPREVKVTIYNIILRRTLLYGSECWAVISKTQSNLQAAEMKVLRVIKGVNRMDEFRNERIRADIGVKRLLDSVEEGRLKWYGHLMNMREGRIARRYLQWKPEGRTPVGRPRKRWLDGVDEALRRRGESLAQVEEREIYEDRKNWREIVRCSPADR